MERDIKLPGFGASYAVGRASSSYPQRVRPGNRVNRGGHYLEPQQAVEGVAQRPDLAPQEGDRPCPTCGDGGGDAGLRIATTPAYVYAIGRVEAHIPSPGIEKEFAQAGARAGAGGTDAQVTKRALQENRYLARQVCWVFRISGMETYLLRPRDPADFALLIEAVRDYPAPTDMDLVIGLLSRNHATCGLFTLPVVAFDQLYSFDRGSLLDAIPRAHEADDKKQAQRDEADYARTSAAVLDRIALMIDNAGATDEHRALNYLVMRYDAIYQRTSAAQDENKRLADISVEPAPVSSTRKMVDVIFNYTDRATDVPDRYFCRVDVEEEFPFLVSALAPYFRR